MIKAFCYFVLLLLSQWIYGQEIVLKGTVKDSLQQSLVYANVIARPFDKTMNMSFAMTDDRGAYQLDLKKDQKYQLTVSFLGYNPKQVILVATQDVRMDFVLKQQTEFLDEVVIIQELPVEVKEDTLTYRTKAFVTGTERKLKAVLNRLPGVEVSKNGQIAVQGRKVTHMLVEGKKFFGGGTKLAVENIPANAVAEVEVIDNYSEIALLKGLVDTEYMAMNIKLKEDKKQFIFGDIAAGKGNKKFYNSHANLFYYSPNTNINFIGDMNNAGKQVFTRRDFMRFEGGISRELTRNSSIFNAQNTDFNSFLDLEEVAARASKFAVFNLTTALTNKIDLSTYALFSKVKTAANSIREKQYLYPENPYREFLSSNDNTNNQLALAKITLDYLPSSKIEWHSNTHVKSNVLNLTQGLISEIDTVNSAFNVFNKTKQKSMKQTLEWHQRFSRRHTVSGMLSYNLLENIPATQWLSDTKLLAGLVPVQDDSQYLLQKQLTSTQHQASLLLKHYWVLSRKSHLYTTIGDSFLSDAFQSVVSQLVADGRLYNFKADGFGNQIKYRLNDAFMGMHFKIKLDKLLLKIGGNAHLYDWEIKQNTLVKRQEKALLPDFMAKYSFYKSERIQFTYAMKNRFASTQQFANKYSLLNYNTVYKGNPDLMFTNYHTARILYTRFNLYKNNIIGIHLGYSKKNEQIKNAIIPVGTDKYTQPFLFENPEESVYFSVDYYKRFGKIKWRYRGRVDRANYFQYINGLSSENINLRQSHKTSIATNFKKAPNVKVGYYFKVSDYTSMSRDIKYITKEPFVTFSYDFLDSFILKADYLHNTFLNKSTSQKERYEYANASLFYKKLDGPWGFEINATNILNSQFRRSSSMSDYLISDTKTYVLPRIFLFTLSYKL